MAEAFRAIDSRGSGWNASRTTARILHGRFGDVHTQIQSKH
jgi:hypothetical protein